MYSAIRNEDYLNIKSLTETGGSAAKNADQTLSTNRDPDSDEALLIATGNSQDTEAFNRLFQRYSSKIFALGMKITRNEQLSNDLVQEAMLNVWRKARLYDLDRGSAQGWIFTTSRNRCFDMLRKLKRQPQCVTADDIWPQEGDADSESAHEGQGSLATETAIIVSYCEQLPDLQKAVIEQVYVLDRTHEEAAAVLEIPLGTLKSRLRLAVSKLRKLIGVDQ
jgi:RNA polymerase sigma-70 factor (ECF subfamily)|tara:strand:- start:512 stop:1177 length:666 start_codon:yes stop_codon:yes gene_type:complete